MLGAVPFSVNVCLFNINNQQILYIYILFGKYSIVYFSLMVSRNNV